MNRFLVYVSGDLKARNAVLAAVNAIGAFRPADFNEACSLGVVSTEQPAMAVQAAIASAMPNATYFVAKLENVGYRGDAQFSSTLKTLVDEPTGKH